MVSIKSRILIILTSIKKLDLISTELNRLGCQWTSEDFNEIDCSRIKSLTVRDILKDRNDASIIVQSQECVKCPSFSQHVSKDLKDL